MLIEQEEIAVLAPLPEKSEQSLNSLVSLPTILDSPLPSTAAFDGIPIPPPLPYWGSQNLQSNTPLPPPLPQWRSYRPPQANIRKIPVPPPLPANWNFPANRALLKPQPQPANLLEQIENAQTPEEITCPVCWEEVKGAEAVTLIGCHHTFCLECVRDHFKVAIFNGKAKDINCLSPGCKIAPSEIQIQNVLPQEIFVKYHFSKGAQPQQSPQTLSVVGVHDQVVRTLF